MKTPKRNNAQSSGAERSRQSKRVVDPDQPLPEDPSPNGPDDDPKIDEAFAGKKYGEGNYEAAKDYGKRVRSYVRSGDIERAADAAAPRDQAEAQDLAEAEREGLGRSKGEDSSPGASRAKKGHDTQG